MTRKYSNLTYWCAEFTDSESGLITEVGNEASFAALTLWVQKNLDKLPKGEGKLVKKSLRKH